MGGDTHALSSCFLAYRSARGAPDSLKLEVNYMYRVPLGEPEEKETRVAFEAPLRFRLVSFAELLGGKLVALLDRTAPRDLYDTAMLAEVVDVDDLFMRRVFVAMAGILPRALWEYSATRIERIEDRDLQRATQHGGRGGQSPLPTGSSYGGRCRSSPGPTLEGLERCQEASWPR